MAGSPLWAVDVYRRVFSLSAARGPWRPAADILLELKRVTGSQHCCWGIGCHHQLYLHVYASQVPVRHQEETYENQVFAGVYLSLLLSSNFHLTFFKFKFCHLMFMLFYLRFMQLTKINSSSTDLWLHYRLVTTRAHYLRCVCISTQLWFRTGIRQQNPEGFRWEPIQVPREVAQVSAGPKDLLWVVLWDRQLLARTGISKDCPEAVHVAVGISVVWAVTKDNKMLMLSVGPNDQVWGVGSDDRTVYFRHGVTATEVTGRSWVAVSAQLDGSQSTNHSSVFAGEVTAPSQGSILDCDDTDIPKPHIPKITSDSFISALVSERSAPTHDPPSVPEGTQVTSQESDSSILSPSSPSGGSETPWSNVDLKEMKGSVATYPIELLQNTVVQEEPPPWAWVTTGGFDIDSSSHVDWFNISDPGPLSPSITPALSALDTDTRTERAQQERNASIEKAVRVTRGCMCWWRDWPPHQWEDVSVTLEQVTGAGEKKVTPSYVYAVIKEVTALVPVFRDSLYTVAVYTPERTKQRRPILLATPSQQDFNTWLSLLNESCCASRELGERPSKQALWAVTCKGDILVHEPAHSLEAPAQYLPCDHMFWRQVPAHLLCVESNSLGVVWGIAHDHTAWVYTGGGRGPSAQGNENISQAICDVRSVYIYENQRWNPMTGYTEKGLPTDRYMWSDASGLRECTKDNTSPPSAQWTWVSDWAVDYGVPGGSDKEGWQYAADFPVTFHGYKTMKDFVRRRRWARKCKISLTGPWQKVPPIALTDVTVLPCLAQCSLEQVPVWAISEKGDVLCCLGATANNPAVSIKPCPYPTPTFTKQGHLIHKISFQLKGQMLIPPFHVKYTTVFNIDDNKKCNLWYRQGLTPSYPQGSVWELISSNVCKVSVGPLDQVWIIADKTPGYPSESSGTVCHRLGVKPMQPKGLSWDFGIGGGWEHLSVRGNSIEAQRVAPRSPMPSRTQSQANGNVVGC
uniref:Tectonin beta-propeller repeat containing 1b n=1 Tax=Sinocyclocheilus anshuiensis TaxID=1608454 RepID=A0A671SVV9_9TELE